MKTLSIKSILALLLTFLFIVSCASEKENSCEEDQDDLDWQAVTKNDDCSNEEKAEAYLALAGFSSYELINQGNRTIPEVLGLNGSNWATKKGYADTAVSLVSSLSTGTQKTIYFFGSILGLYTTAMGNLDNGQYDPSTDATSDASADAFDGELYDSEINHFAGSGIALDSSPDDGMSIDAVDAYFQVRVNGQSEYFIYDWNVYETYYTDPLNYPFNSPPVFIYLDTNADGTSDGNHSNSTDYFNDMTSDGLAEFNQIFKLNALTDPFKDRNDLSADITVINTFAADIYQYITNIESGASNLGIDASEDYMEDLAKYKSDLDNGAECKTLTEQKSIKIFQYLTGAFQDVSADDYSDKNLVELSELVRLGVDSTPDTSALSGILSIAKVGAKFRFRSKADPNVYLPYWKNDSTSDINDLLSIIQRFEFNDVTSDDGKVTFSEIICAADATSDATSDS